MFFVLLAFFDEFVVALSPLKHAINAIIVSAEYYA